MSKLRYSIVIWAALLGSCEGREESDRLQREEKESASTVSQEPGGCHEYRTAVQFDKKERASARLEDYQAFDALIHSASGDPELEAKRAAEEGRFGLLVHSLLVPGNYPEAIGLNCNPRQEFLLAEGMTRAGSAASDIMRPPEGIVAVSALGKFTTFAYRYNSALIRQPSYPYRDICRPTTRDYERPKPFERVSPEQYGHRDLVETDQPADLYEAARRGSLSSLEKMLRAKEPLVNRPDVLQMTPLAWAIVYGRRDQAKLLLEHGAGPNGAVCSTSTYPEAPISLARALRRRDLVALMERHSNPALWLPFPRPYLDRALSKKVLPIGPISETQRLAAKLLITADGHISQCTFENSGLTMGFADRLCHEFKSKLVYFPGTDEDGNPTAQEIEQKIRLEPDES